MMRKKLATVWGILTMLLPAAGNVPALVSPSRGLPAGFELYRGMISGDLALIRSQLPGPDGYQIETCYRFEGGQWITIANPLPFSRWPVATRDGLLAFRVPGTGNDGPTRTIVEANSGEVLWQGLPEVQVEEFTRDYHVAFTSAGMVVRNRSGSSATYPYPGLYQPYRACIHGNEIAHVSYTPNGSLIVRQDLATGAVLNTWPQVSAGQFAGFHSGKVLLTRLYSTTDQVSVLVPGEALPVPVAFPGTYKPGGERLSPGLYWSGPEVSKTSEGVLIRVDSSTLLHFNMSGTTVGCDRVVRGHEVISYDGSRLVVTEGNELPAYVDVASDAPPVISFGTARGRETAGHVDVEVCLDRPPLVPVRVRVATRAGGSAGFQDYTATESWLEFPAGVSSGKFTFPVTPDHAIERHETVLVDIVAAEGAEYLPGTSTAAVIEASGVERTFVASPPVVVSWPFSAPKEVTGGDGLFYRLTGLRTPDPRVEVVEPATNAVIEIIPVSGERPGTTSTNYDPYLEVTAAGARCLFRDSDDTHAWDFRGQPSQPAVEVGICAPVEGGIDGYLELRQREASLSGQSIQWSWSVARLPSLWPGAQSNPIREPLGEAVLPADGSVLRIPVSARSLRSTERKMPLCLQIASPAGEVSQFHLVEPGSAAFQTPVGTTITGDPSIAPGWSPGPMAMIGDRMYLGRPMARDLQDNPRPCIEVHDSTTGQHLQTILAPATLTHEGFATAISGDDRDLFVYAEEWPDLPKLTPKILSRYRTVLVLDRATGALKATLKGPYANFGQLIRFSDHYLAICAPSSIDTSIRGSKTPGAVMLYRRSDYRLLGSMKLAGNGTGTSMVFIGDTLFLGMPGLPWINRGPNLPRPETWEHAGGVYAFTSLPSLKKPKLFVSPTGPRQGAGFGLRMAATPEGDLLVSEGTTTVHRFDPVGSRPPTIEEQPQDKFPMFSYQELDGLRIGGSGDRLYDTTTRSPLVEFESIDGALLGHGVVFTRDWRSPSSLMSVPRTCCGNYDLWAGEELAGSDPADDGNDNGKPDLEDYILDQAGALPTLESDFLAYHNQHRKVRFRVSQPLPPDVVMLVESSYAGGPWRIAALKRGASPIQNAHGWKADAQGWTVPTDDAVVPEAYELRTSFVHAQALVMGEGDFRVTLPP